MGSLLSLVKHKHDYHQQHPYKGDDTSIMIELMHPTYLCDSCLGSVSICRICGKSTTLWINDIYGITYVGLIEHLMSRLCQPSKTNQSKSLKTLYGGNSCSPWYRFPYFIYLAPDRHITPNDDFAVIMACSYTCEYCDMEYDVFPDFRIFKLHMEKHHLITLTT